MMDTISSTTLLCGGTITLRPAGGGCIRIDLHEGYGDSEIQATTVANEMQVLNLIASLEGLLSESKTKRRP